MLSTSISRDKTTFEWQVNEHGVYKLFQDRYAIQRVKLHLKWCFQILNRPLHKDVAKEVAKYDKLAVHEEPFG